jgi:RHS repeat-associated protein
VPAGSTGNYTLKVISADYGSGYTLTTSYPRAYKETIGYANDLAVVTQDGVSTVTETVSSSGRVLRRTVTDDVSGQVSEDTTFGYDGSGDSPAYSKPTTGGAVTTYINGPDGLLVIDTAGTPSYPIQNAHGDSVGATDTNGVYTANPATDEWGVGTPPANRLGWLGGKERFSTGGNLGLIRMGIRLMDPALGRFLSVDAIAGGSANDYDYCYADPINCNDLGGTQANRRYRTRRMPSGVMWKIGASFNQRVASDKDYFFWVGAVNVTILKASFYEYGSRYDGSSGKLFFYRRKMSVTTRTYDFTVGDASRPGLPLIFDVESGARQVGSIEVVERDLGKGPAFHSSGAFDEPW